MKPIWRALLVALFLGAMGYGVAKLNLWGAQASSQRGSDSIVQRLFADRYPTHRPGERVRTADPNAAPRVRIVYLGDATMPAMRPWGWVGAFPSVGQQAQMLSDLAAPPGLRPPRAVFLDMLYYGHGLDAAATAAQQLADEDYGALINAAGRASHAAAWRDRPICRDTPLLKIACMIRAGGVAVVIGKASAAEALTPVQQALDEVALLAPVEAALSSYPLTFDGLAGSDARQISPAMALYAAACFGELDQCGEPVLKAAWQAAQGTEADTAAFDAEREPMDVVWGARDPAALSDAERIGDCQDVGLVGAYLDALIWRPKPGGGGRGQACPYTPSAAYEAVVGRLATDRPRLERLLSDNVVLVGSQMAGSGDWIASPVQGPIPGVHYHAMALANLLDWGLGGYRRESLGGVDADLVEAVLVALLSFVSLVLLMIRNDQWAKAEAVAPHRLNARGGRRGLCLRGRAPDAIELVRRAGAGLGARRLFGP